MMPFLINLQKAAINDAQTLVDISKKTFLDAFAHLNNPDDVDAYVSVAFTLQQLLTELGNPNSEFYFALLDDEIVGYIKLNYANAQTEFQDKNAIEIERVYVLANHQRKQIGNQLLDFATEKAKNDNLEYIWLGVWEHNQQAIRFYERKGFYIFSRHEFMLGNDKQTDLLMKRQFPADLLLPGDV